MDQALSIWSPVIIAELKNPRKYHNQVTYQIGDAYKAMDDLRIKIKRTDVKIQGKAVVTTISLDILFLVQDETGHMRLIAREEIIRDRVPLVDFQPSFNSEKKSSVLIDIKNIHWEGGLAGCQLRADYFIEYVLLAIKEQVVKLFADENGGIKQEAWSDILHRLEEELIRVIEEKKELDRRVYFYERDIKSLKIGINKLQNRNALINSELLQYRLQIEQLHKQIYDKERQISGLAQTGNISPKSGRPEREQKVSWLRSNLNLSNRIKNMFANIF